MNLDAILQRKLKEMVLNGKKVADISNEIRNSLNLEKNDRLTVFNYFKETFSLPLKSVMILGASDYYNDGNLNDEQLNDILLPKIIANKDIWIESFSLANNPSGVESDEN